jgi:hypothetical protein
VSEPAILTRPKPRPGRAQIDELRKLLRHREIIEAAIELEAELRVRQLDARLTRAGFSPKRKRRWPRERPQAEATGQILRRGPEVWGSLVKVHRRSEQRSA